VDIIFKSGFEVAARSTRSDSRAAVSVSVRHTTTSLHFNIQDFGHQLELNSRNIKLVCNNRFAVFSKARGLSSDLPLCDWFLPNLLKLEKRAFESGRAAERENQQRFQAAPGLSSFQVVSRHRD
jgi:hypothetical protein